MGKTNAIRTLETSRVSFETASYEVDESDLTGETVAHRIGADPDTVFKTLVCSGDKNGYVVFCIPVTTNLDLKKAAVSSGNKKVEMIKVRELFPLTGYVRGGCSPVGMKKQLQTYIDETAQLFDRIYVSAGVRGMQIKLNPDDLAETIGARYADLV